MPHGFDRTAYSNLLIDCNDATSLLDGLELLGGRRFIIPGYLNLELFCLEIHSLTDSSRRIFPKDVQ